MPQKNAKTERNHEILLEYNAGSTLKELAAKHGVSLNRISKILKRETQKTALPKRVQQRFSTGRPVFYAEDPIARAEYIRLRPRYPAKVVHEIVRLNMRDRAQQSSA